MFRSFCDTDRFYGLRSKVGHGSTGSSPSGSPCLPCVHEGCRGRPYPVTGSGRQDPQLPRRLAYSSPIQRAVGRSQGLGAPAPQPVGASGQLGKEQALPCAEAPGAYGIRSCSHAARIASYETTSALATLPGPEVGMAPRYTVSRYLPAVSPLPQPLDRPCLSTGRGAPRTSVPAYCCHNRCLQHGLGRYMQRAGSLGLWTGPRLLWHINCLELWAVHLALRQFRPLLLGKHVLVRTDNTAAVSYINRLGGIRSHRMSQLARHLLLWSHTQFKSLRAVHIPGQLNREADALSRQLTFPGEWRLHPETIRLIWSRFGEAQVDLFASPESSHCQLYFSLTEGPLGTDALAHSWPRALRKYAFPPVSLLAQTLCKLREDEEQVLLVAPHWPTRTWFPELISLHSTSLAHSSEEGPPFSGARHHMAPASRSMEPPCVAPGRDAADLSGLPPAVVETIIQARAPSTRQTYALKWSLFATWCSSRREDPRRCTIGVVLSFLQERLERRLSPSTLKVYVAAIAAHHDAVDGRSLESMISS